MKGHRPIVLRLVNHQFHEHDTLDSAVREAERLTSFVGGTCVVYVPVVVVTPPQPRMTQRVELPSELVDTDLPF